MSKIKYFLQQSWLLIVTSFFFGLLIAATNAALAPRIAFNEKEKLDSLMRSLMPGAASFDKTLADVKIITGKGKAVATDVFKGLDADNRLLGYAFIAAGPGFQDKIKLVIAVDGACEKFLGYRVLSSNETPNFGSRIKEDYFADQFVNVPLGTLELVKTGDAATIDSEIVAISGATVSSEAVVNIFNTYMQGIKEQLRSKGLISDAR